MKTIGRSLVFYLKYFKEMEVLFESGDDIDEEILLKVPNKEEFLKTLNEIGEKAYDQAADLLTEAINRAKRTLPRNIAYEEIHKKNHIRNNWTVGLWVWPKGKKRNPQKWQVGISYDSEYKNSPCFIAWVWAKGGRKSEINIANILAKKKYVVKAKDMDWNAGSVSIGIFPLYFQNVENFEVNAESFLSEVEQKFKELAPNLKKIISM